MNQTPSDPNEPTQFGASQPSQPWQADSGQPAGGAHSAENQPTQFGGTNDPTQFGGTNEPTQFGGNNAPTQFSGTGEQPQFGAGTPSQPWQNAPSQPQPAVGGQFGQPAGFGPVDQFGNPLPVDQFGNPIPVDPFGNPVDQYGNPLYGAPGVAGPAAPNFFTKLPLSIKLTLGAALLGIVNFFMGFVAWVSIDPQIERDFEEWAEDQAGNDSFGIPAFLTMVGTPGFFLLGLGVAGVAALGMVAAKWRKYLPHITFLTIVSWLGLLAAGLGLPGFISFGAGAYVALIFGFFQLALLAYATIVEGMKDDERPAAAQQGETTLQ